MEISRFLDFFVEVKVVPFCFLDILVAVLRLRLPLRFLVAVAVTIAVD